MAFLLLAGLLTGCPGDPPPPPCAPSPTQQPGQACGPCGMDTLVCEDSEWVCDGATECGLGDTCGGDSDCATGVCDVGRCVPDGMVFVQAGTFLMGSPATEFGRTTLETQHPVRLTRHYFMDAHEITQSEFESVMGYNPSFFTGCGPDCPVESMRWVEMLAYANARSEAEGLPPCYDLTPCTGVPGVNFLCEPPIPIDLDCAGYRLPTEAEWEYAYRAGTTTPLYVGESESFSTCDQPLLERTAQFCGNCSVTYGQTFDCSMNGNRPDQPTDCGPTAVGSFEPNSWGLYDMAGNLAEAVFDTQSEYDDFAEDPTGPAEQTGFVGLRGAGFCGHYARTRAADRKFTTWTNIHPGTGFRLVRTYRSAPPEERLGEEICDNGCGGCRPLIPARETPCGPCAADSYVCASDTETACEVTRTDCRYGQLCDGGCPVGSCSNGHCVPDGFVYVPAGFFEMGSRPGEPGRDADEPPYDVILERGFLMQAREATQAEWARLMGNNPSRFVACGEDCPVETVNRHDGMAFANAMSRSQELEECYDLSDCTGVPGESFTCPDGIDFDPLCEGYRLPTEAEWERAYRADTRTAFYNGTPTTGALCDQPLLQEIANFCGNCAQPYEGTHDCSEFGGFATCGPQAGGARAPNALGLYDMSGNVAEIVWDLYGAYPDFARNPQGPADTGQQQITRGGGFCSHMARHRAADRRAISRTARLFDVGLRLVRTMPDDGTGPVCNNGCGGCRPLSPAVGTPCGPCLADRYACDGTEAVACDGATTACNFGTACTNDMQCQNAVCLGGFCTAPGFRYVPPGSFIMGSPPTEPLRNANETEHPVTLTRGFLMMEGEVTQAEFESALRVNPSEFLSCGPDCPVENVTWLDALAYANARSRSEGLTECYDLSACTGSPGGNFVCPFEVSFSLDCEGYRLPTEAEWEYAYRAGTSQTFYVGDPATARNCDQPLLSGHAQYCGNCEVTYEGGFDCSATGGFASCGTLSVGSLGENPLGLHDMSGNVAELVWDVLETYPASATDPTGPAHSGQNNIARGGGFCAHFARLRAADRRGLTRVARFPDVGIRLVRTVP